MMTVGIEVAQKEQTVSADGNLISGSQEHKMVLEPTSNGESSILPVSMGSPGGDVNWPTGERAAKRESELSEDDDDDMPLSKFRKRKRASTKPEAELTDETEAKHLRTEKSEQEQLQETKPSTVAMDPGTKESTDALVADTKEGIDAMDEDLPLSAMRRQTSKNGHRSEVKVIVRKREPQTEPKKILRIVKTKKTPAQTAKSEDPKSKKQQMSTPAKTIKPKPAAKNGSSSKTTAAKAKTPKKGISHYQAPASVSIKKDEYVFVGDEKNGDENRWWDDNGNDPNADGEEKWQTLSHNGVLFPPPYEPANVPLVYNKEDIALSPDSEEVAMFYAAKLGTDYVQKPKFNRNFFDDFRATLKRHDKPLFKKISNFSLCDFSKMHAHLEEQKAKKKALTSAEKKEIKEAEAERVKKYTVAVVDGREEKVGNFRIEPPALFLGRGEHPLMGKVKKRVQPEEVTINIGKNEPVPECPVPGRRWGKVIHNKTVTWLAYWKNTINNGAKYVWLSAESKFKTISDAAKFEKARKLHKHIEKIRKDYRKGWSSSDTLVQQRSLALYLIDFLALRVGNEKNEDEADTVGCCSLRKEHVSFREPNTVEFDFLGKDSIRYLNAAQIDKKAFRELKKLTAKKKPDAEVFDRLTTSSLNEYLKSLMDGLSAKVFRTYNASLTLDRLLREGNPGATLNEKRVFYNQQNKEVAILCNHQRALPKAHESQMEKMGKKLEETLEWLRELEDATKRLEESGEEAATVTQWMQPKPELQPDMTDEEKAQARKQAAEAPRISKERVMKKDSLVTTAARVRERIEKIKADMTTKDDLKTVALGTSKLNYLDPRISVAWCKKYEVPIENVFPRSVISKFAWSMEASEEFVF